ncbi:hypothetical protein ACOMHN_022687 [Nucella lapillus]
MHQSQGRTLAGPNPLVVRGCFFVLFRDEPTPTHGKHSVTCYCLDIALLRASLVWGLGVSDSKEKFCWSGFTTFFLVLGGMFLSAFGVGYTGDCLSTSSAEIRGSAS